MAELALNDNKELPKPVVKSLGDNREIKEKLLETHTEELIIGLCCPIGTDIHFVAEELKQVISEKFDYEVEIIRLSDFIKDKMKIEPKPNKFESISALIEGGNQLREEKGPSVLAELAISQIAKRRELKKQQSGEFKSDRICYIVDSLKNSQELETFRLVYSNLFYFIGVFSNLETRERFLEKIGVSKYNVHQLIDRDSGEEKKFGQKVSETFMQADFFLRIDSLTSAALRFKVERYLNLIFASEVITPTIHETAMYQAFAAAGNSACLSRQVGASITNQKGEIISIGWNDVPKYEGGLYTTESTDLLGIKDKRCLNLDGGVCFNDAEKDIIRELLVDKLIDENLIKKEDKIKVENVIRSSRIKELIEFSRAVHAEMHALIIGSQNAGIEVVGGSLYCTTYPCHNCARHLIAAGIKNVYYIEPYRKSLAVKLHEDSISENESDEGKKVRILMFDGVSPRRYLEFFRMLPNSRKENGKRKVSDKKNVYPKNTVTLSAIPLLEKKVIQDLQSKKLIDTVDEAK